MSIIPLEAKDWEKVVSEYAEPAFSTICLKLRDGFELTAHLAISPAQRAWGMIGKTFENFDAMLFVHQEPTIVAFHGYGIKQALWVALFDQDGTCLKGFELQIGQPPVRTDEFKYAVEVAKDCEFKDHLESGIAIPDTLAAVHEWV